MHSYDCASNIFCLWPRAKLQPHSLSSLKTIPHQQNAYETVLRDLHWHSLRADCLVVVFLGRDGRQVLTIAAAGQHMHALVRILLCSKYLM